MSPISSVQQGAAALYEVAKLLILGSGGLLEPAFPATDDERRDFELHVKGDFSAYYAFQLKSAIYLRHVFRSYNLAITFTVRKDRLISDPFFWYILVCLDLERLAARDPLFLINSEDMHRHASPRLVGDTWHFEVAASLSPDSKDHWRPTQVAGRDLAKRVLELFKEPALRTPPGESTIAQLSQLDSLVWVRHRAQ